MQRKPHSAERIESNRKDGGTPRGWHTACRDLGNTDARHRAAHPRILVRIYDADVGERPRVLAAKAEVEIVGD